MTQIPLAVAEYSPDVVSCACGRPFERGTIHACTLTTIGGYQDDKHEMARQARLRADINEGKRRIAD